MHEPEPFVTPPGISTVRLLEFPLKRFPNKTALIDSTGQASFAQVERRAEALAGAFTSAGVSPGDRAALILPNGIPFIVTEVAMLKAGLVKVPLNIRFHANEVRYALADCEPTVLVCEAEWARALKNDWISLPSLKTVFVVGEPVSGFERYDVVTESGARAPMRSSYRADDPILIRYTGGTTGRPKGIVHTERSFLNANLDVIRELNCCESDVALHVGHLSHGLNFMWAAYYAMGATQILHERFDPSAILGDIERHRVTFTYMVPTMIHRLLQADDASADISSLRTFMYASAPMPVPLLRRAIGRYGNIFTQVYTLSESPVITTMLRAHEHLDRDTNCGPRLGSCGREVLTMALRLIDDEGNDVAEGEVGEIAVRSINNMAAYWRLPEETARTLVDGWLRTGDLARRDKEGFHYIVDRKNDVIITGAFNVYPKEVEDVLYRHPAVAGVAVVGIPEEEWGECLKAFIVLHEGQTATVEELLALCRENLAGYKKPREFEFVSSLPLSPVGKVLRRALRNTTLSEG
jgi:acyl-CoA synthetase (AMP-forming)/AMP-acid ligase II